MVIKLKLNTLVECGVWGMEKVQIVHCTLRRVQAEKLTINQMHRKTFTETRSNFDKSICLLVFYRRCIAFYVNYRNNNNNHETQMEICKFDFMNTIIANCYKDNKILAFYERKLNEFKMKQQKINNIFHMHWSQ